MPPAEIAMPSGIASTLSLSRQCGVALGVVLAIAGSTLVLRPPYDTGATISGDANATAARATRANGEPSSDVEREMWTSNWLGDQIDPGRVGTTERPAAELPPYAGTETPATTAASGKAWPPKPQFKDIALILAHTYLAKRAPSRNPPRATQLMGIGGQRTAQEPVGHAQEAGGAPAVIEVRASSHEDFERIVFDWPVSVVHEVTLRGDQLIVAFDRPARIELAGLLKRVGPRVTDARTEDGASTTRVWMRVGRQVRFRSFSLAGNRVVVDVLDAQPPQAGAPRPPELHAGDAIEELREELRRRDAQIAGLLARVEQLERRGLLSEPDLDLVAAGGSGASGSAPGSSPSASASPVEPEEHQSAEPAVAQAAPGEFEVEEEEIDRALERTLVQTGVLLLPYGKAEVDPSFSYTRWERDSPTFVTEDGTVFVGEQEVRRNEFQTAQSLRLGLPFDAQLEVGVPYRYVDESTVTKVGFGERRESDGSGSGYGDITVGVAKTLLRENGGWWPDIVGRVRWDSDTGKTISGKVPTGGGFNEVAGSLSVVKRQDPLAFVGGVSYETTFENNDIKPGDELGFSIGAVLAASPATSLRLGLDQSFVNETRVNGGSIDGSDQTIGTLSIGAASILGPGVLLNGAVDIGLTDDAPDYAVRASLPVQFDLPIY
jgi:hypothetical protein